MWNSQWKVQQIRMQHWVSLDLWLNFNYGACKIQESGLLGHCWLYPILGISYLIGLIASELTCLTCPQVMLLMVRDHHPLRNPLQCQILASPFTSSVADQIWVARDVRGHTRVAKRIFSPDSKYTQTIQEHFKTLFSGPSPNLLNQNLCL